MWPGKGCGEALPGILYVFDRPTCDRHPMIVTQSINPEVPPMQASMQMVHVTDACPVCRCRTATVCGILAWLSLESLAIAVTQVCSNTHDNMMPRRYNGSMQCHNAKHVTEASHGISYITDERCVRSTVRTMAEAGCLQSKWLSCQDALM